MRTLSLFALLLALLPAAGCVDPNCDGKIITVSPNATTDGSGENVDVGTPCYTVDNGGIRDYSGCCPSGFEYLAVAGDGSILCEEDCGLGSTAAVDAAGKTAFVVHALADAGFDAVDALSSAP